MNRCKDILLNAYYARDATPRRRRGAADRAARGMEPVSVLFYHRVADDHPNDWTMSTATFAKQIRWLKERFDLVIWPKRSRGLPSGRNRARRRASRSTTATPTTCEFAVPLLLKEQDSVHLLRVDEPRARQSAVSARRAAGRPLAPNTLATARNGGGRRRDRRPHAQPHPPGRRLAPTRSRTRSSARSTTWNRRSSAKCATLRFLTASRKLEHRGVPDRLRGRLPRRLLGLRRLQLSGRRPVSFAPLSRRLRLVRFKNWLTVDPRKLRIQSISTQATSAASRRRRSCSMLQC